MTGKGPLCLAFFRAKEGSAVSYSRPQAIVHMRKVNRPHKCRDDTFGRSDVQWQPRFGRMFIGCFQRAVVCSFSHLCTDLVRCQEIARPQGLPPLDLSCSVDTQTQASLCVPAVRPQCQSWAHVSDDCTLWHQSLSKSVVYLESRVKRLYAFREIAVHETKFGPSCAISKRGRFGQSAFCHWSAFQLAPIRPLKTILAP